jgi:hypothetical protein
MSKKTHCQTMKAECGFALILQLQFVEIGYINCKESSSTVVGLGLGLFPERCWTVRCVFVVLVCAIRLLPLRSSNVSHHHSTTTSLSN